MTFSLFDNSGSVKAVAAFVVALLFLVPGSSPAQVDEHGHDHGDDQGHDHGLETTPAVEEEEHLDVVLLSPAEQIEFGIELATAGGGSISSTTSLPGEIHPNDDRLAHLVPRYDGIVTEVKAHEGDQVKKGQVLAIIESNDTLAPYPLKTMIDGTVIAKHITLGEAASPDRVPFVVADLSSVWVNLSISQRDLMQIKPGQLVRILVEGNVSVAEGQISYVTPIVDETTRTATARVVLDNSNNYWRPGMFVIGKVELSSIDVAVIVPNTALFTLHDETVVFIQDDHGFEARSVLVGSTDCLFSEIVAGIHAGDQFVSKGGFTLKAELEKASFGHGHAH